MLASQREYHDLRAPDYSNVSGPSDGKSRGLLDLSTVQGVVDQLAPMGDVLELACGAGAFTRELAAMLTGRPVSTGRDACRRSIGTSSVTRKPALRQRSRRLAGGASDFQQARACRQTGHADKVVVKLPRVVRPCLLIQRRRLVEGRRQARSVAVRRHRLSLPHYAGSESGRPDAANVARPRAWRAPDTEPMQRRRPGVDQVGDEVLDVTLPDVSDVVDASLGEEPGERLNALPVRDLDLPREVAGRRDRCHSAERVLTLADTRRTSSAVRTQASGRRPRKPR